jgi:hypothetical protein
MKQHLQNRFVALALLALSTFNHQLSTARAQNTAFTYQGRVMDNGTNFSGTSQFEFALGTNTNTTSGQAAGPVGALSGDPGGVVVSGGSIISITMIPAEYANANVGSGYTSPPTVTIEGTADGHGSGATATAQIGGGSVTNVIVTSGGSGYFPGEVTVLFSAPQGGVVFTAVWNNDDSFGQNVQPVNAVSVPVTNGLFTVVLGDTNLPNMTAISASLFTQSGLQLQIWFNDGYRHQFDGNNISHLCNQLHLSRRGFRARSNRARITDSSRQA